MSDRTSTVVEIESKGSRSLTASRAATRQRRQCASGCEGQYLLEVPLMLAWWRRRVYIAADYALSAGAVANVRIIVREVDEDEGEGGEEP